MKTYRIFLNFLLIMTISPLYSLDKISPGFVAALSIPYYTGKGFTSLLDELGTDETRYMNNPVFGFTAGAALEYSFNNFYSLNFEVLLSGTGGGIASKDSQEDVSTILVSEMNLEIPILFKAGRYISQDKKLYVMSGPQFSYLLSDNIYEQNGPEFYTTDPEWNHFNPFGIGILSGVGIEFYQKKLVLVVELRYLREFTDSLKGRDDIKQNAISFTAGMRFRNQGKAQ